MTVPKDEADKPDGKSGATKNQPSATKDGEATELSPEELEKVSGGSPQHTDWINFKG
jgi:hypothetical protein